MKPTRKHESTPATDAAVATKAVLRAAERLDLSNKTLARVIGVSEATVSRMSAGSYQLARGEKPFELGLLFVRLFRSLDAIVGGDQAASTAWMRSEKIVTAAFTGLRLGELLALRWRDVDFANSAIHVRQSFTNGRVDTPKSGRERTVPMAQPSKAAASV